VGLFYTPGPRHECVDVTWVDAVANTTFERFKALLKTRAVCSFEAGVPSNFFV